MPESLDQFAARLVVAGSRFARTVAMDAGEQRSLVAMRVLSNLVAFGPQRIGELAARERLTQPAMTTAVKRLEGEELVTRGSDPGDARASVVTITEQGQAALVTFRNRAGEAISPALAALPASDLAALRRAAEIMEQLTAQHEDATLTGGRA